MSVEVDVARLVCCEVTLVVVMVVAVVPMSALTQSLLVWQVWPSAQLPELGHALFIMGVDGIVASLGQ